MMNFANTNQLLQSSVKTVWCSFEIFKNMKINFQNNKNYTYLDELLKTNLNEVYFQRKDMCSF